MNNTLDFLIVDDDAQFAHILGRSLKRRGFASRWAATGEAAQQELAEQSPDYILLDLKLESESGLQLLPQLRELAPEAGILILTGYSSVNTAVEAIKLGAINYLCKPASTDEILQALDAVDGNPDVAIDDQPLSVDRLEWEHIQRVLQEHDGNVSSTARALGMHRRTLQRKLQKRPVKR